MYFNVEKSSASGPPAWLAPMALGLGLAMLAGAIFWRLPALTGMALVTLGATVLTLERFRFNPWMPLILVAHGAIYGSLYALAVAATSSGPRAEGGSSLVAGADLATSLVIMTAAGLVVATCWRVVRTDG
jgi:hypothetical protein